MYKKLFPKKRYLIATILILITLGFSFWYIREFEVLPAPAYNLLNEISEPTDKDSILVISPHPDDETLGAGGFMERAIEQKAKLNVVIVTDGNKHGLKSIRHKETISALKIIGLSENKITFFDFPDSRLSDFQGPLNERLESIITETKPTIILGTHPSDIHPDHAAVGRAIDTIIPNLATKPKVYQYLIHYHRYPRPEGFHPDSFLLPPVKLITTTTAWQKFSLDEDEQTTKNEAVLQYKSQLSRKNLILRGLLLSFIRQNELFVVANL